MGDIDMADAGGVSVQLPIDPLQKSNAFFSIPPTTTQIEADLYSKLKKLQRELEFLSLQEVSPTVIFSQYRNTLKMNNAV
jgi:hypothetical protein